MCCTIVILSLLVYYSTVFICRHMDCNRLWMQFQFIPLQLLLIVILTHQMSSSSFLIHGSSPCVDVIRRNRFHYSQQVPGGLSVVRSQYWLGRARCYVPRSGQTFASLFGLHPLISYGSCIQSKALSLSIKIEWWNMYPSSWRSSECIP